MAKFVPYLAEEAIERNAEALLTESAHARDVVIEPPIPIVCSEFPAPTSVKARTSWARYFSMKSGLLLTKVSTPKSTRTRKAVIASP